MFKNLKDKLATQVNKTNQTLFSSILPTDSTLLSKDSGNRTSSITSHEDNHENNRSRLDSASSDISQTSNATANYVSPSRHFMPPSDVESEHGGNESDHETNTKMEKLLVVYKNKFAQLKNAYDEIEREKDNIKTILQQQQDVSIKRQTELRQQIKVDRQAKEQIESLYLKEIKSRESKIEELNHELTEQKHLVQSSQGEIQSLREKNTKLETLLVRCKEKIKTHQEKQADLVAERDTLLQQLNEKQTSTESIIKDRQLEVDLELAKTKSDLHNEFNKQKDEDLSKTSNDKLNLEKTNNDLQESILNDQQKIEELSTEIEILKKSLSTEIEEHRTSYDILKTEHENLTNELQQVKQAKDNIQSLLDETIQERTMYKDKYEQIQQHEHTDDQANATLTKLQHDYDESLANYTQLTQKLATQRQEHLEEIAALKRQQQIEFENNIKELQEENNRLKSQNEHDQQKAIEQLTTEFENTRKEELSVLENELQAAANRAQQEISRLQQILNEQMTKSNQYEEELKELGKLKFQSNLSQKGLTDEYNSLKEQHQQSIKQNNEQVINLQDELAEKIEHIEHSEKQLDAKQKEIVQLTTTMERLKITIKSIETSQINNQQLLEQKDKEINTLKQNLSDQQSHNEKLNQEHQQIIEQLQSEIDKQKAIINEKQEEFNNLRQQLISQLSEKDDQLFTFKTKLDEQQNLNSQLQQQHNERYFELETKLNHILSEKTDLETELDNTRIQVQSTASILNEKTNENSIKLEQKIKELETEGYSYRNEIETLKSEIVSLINIKEDDTRRMDDFENEKFIFEQEIAEKDRQITESNEKIQELELTVKQSKESVVKFRQALQKMKESATNKEQTNVQDIEYEYEQRFQEQEKEFHSKIKTMAKQMSAQIEEKEQESKQQLHDFMQKHHKTEDDLAHQFEQRLNKAEERALIAEKERSKMQEQLKENQLDHHRIVQDLQIQVQKLIRQTPQTTENSVQTAIEDIERNHLTNHGQHSFVFEPTEVDYLKQIVLAYMTGTDRITMAKVICAVLRYTDDEKSLIIEHEKLRHTRWINSTR